jgi:hypothetical protein
VELPLFVMVRVVVAVCPTVTFPKAKFPLNAIVRVGVAGVDGAVGVVLPPPHADAKIRSRTTQPRLNFGISAPD